MASASKLYWSPHSDDRHQQFIRLNTRNHDLCLYDVNSLKGDKIQYELVAKQTKIPDMRCFDWSPIEEDLVAVGQSSGETLVLRLRDKGASSITLAAKQQRACNSIAFNREGLLAIGLDRVRHDSSLNIWDINHRIGSSDSSKPQPSRKLASSEVIHSVRFFDDQPNLLVAGAGCKYIRIFDLRETPSNPTLTAPTRCVNGISIDKNQNYFAAFSDEGAVSVWDRRVTTRSSGQADSVLHFNKASVDEHGRSSSIIALRYSPHKAGVFAILNTTGALKVYETAKLIEMPVTTLSMADDASFGVDGSGVNFGRGLAKDSIGLGNTKGLKSQEVLLINKITDIVEPLRTVGKVDCRISSFDWISNMGFSVHQDPFSLDLKLLCLRNNGELQVLTTSEAAMSLSFSPRNGLVTTLNTTLISIPSPSGKSRASPPSNSATDGIKDCFRRRPSESVDGTLQIVNHVQNNQQLHDQSSRLSLPAASGDHRPGMSERIDSITDTSDTYLYPPEEVLRNDILFVMKDRVERGYSMDPNKSLSVIDHDGYLKDTWTWVRDAVYRADTTGMVAHYLDLNYIGVKKILNGDLELRYIKGTFRSDEHRSKEVNAACEELRRKFKKEDFIGITNFHARRSLALVVCGWSFNRSELEAYIEELEKKNEFAKAAGCALFHNDIPRCIKSLKQGGEHLKLISTNVASYYANKNSTPNLGRDEWKELCRSMAIEMENPYLRAIFAYISNGDWKDVLDDVGLPIKERLGIAIRFLNDDDLENYIRELSARAVQEGDLEGIVLTGITDTFVDLAQKYIDRTSDVQTCALIASFAWPRYIVDDRVETWIQSYRDLLNKWKYFKIRCRFDVARGYRSRKIPNALGASPLGVIEVQRQIVVRCNNCDRIVSHVHGASRNNKASIGSTGTSAVSTTGAAGPQTATPPFQTQTPTSLIPNTRSTLCTHCQKPFPRCAICLQHLGTPNYKTATRDGKSRDPKADFDRWFTWCMKCNHGTHVGHSREWFGQGEDGKKKMCPVPECQCCCDVL